MASQNPDDITHDDDVTLEHARPAILRFLAGRDEPVEKLELVSIAVRRTECDERDVRVSDLPLDAVHDRVTATHLPALDRNGLVDYDRGRGRVSLAVPSDELDSILVRYSSE